MKHFGGTSALQMCDCENCCAEQHVAKENCLNSSETQHREICVTNCKKKNLVNVVHIWEQGDEIDFVRLLRIQQWSVSTIHLGCGGRLYNPP